MDTVYCYPESDTLRNKLNIKDGKRLSHVERQLTAARLLQLLDSPVKGSFDLKHLQKIHAYIFQDLYDWAGKIRTVDIAKGNMFCNVKFIKENADQIFSELKQTTKEFDLAVSRDVFAKSAAYYLSEINALHPFREGNGRTQREFIREWAMRYGFYVDYTLTSKEEMLAASKASFMRDYSGMEDILMKITS